MNYRSATQQAIAIANSELGKFFPNERMCPRLKNWLYICLTRRNPHYDTREYRREFEYSPTAMLSELAKNHIDSQLVARIRSGGYIDERKLEWIEGTDVFLTVFTPILFKLNHHTITPIIQNASNLTICRMTMDGMDGDHLEKESTLILARAEWLAFKEVINTFTWARKDKGITSIEKIRQAAQELGVERALSNYPPIHHGYWPGFVSYIFSLDMNKEMAQKVSVYAKKLIRQSTRIKTKGKGQVNVLIDTETIKKLEKICRETKLSKAKLITALIDSYRTITNDIDTAFQNTNVQPEHLSPKIWDV
jgi:hypothetical protein